MKALVIGTGVAGTASAALLRHQGYEVLLADDATVPLDHLPDVDLVVPSPGVRPAHHLLIEAARRGCPVWSEIELASRAWKGAMLAVTGTNGKGTVVTMVTDALRRAGHRARAAGNIGDPLGRVVLEEPPSTLLVVEVSSFQLHYVHTLAPMAAAVLNATADHLDWHGSVAAYRADKARIFQAMTADAIAVVNGDDGGAASMAEEVTARLCVFTLGPPPPGGLGVVGGWVADDGGQRLLQVVGLADHEIHNAMATLALVRAVDERAQDAAAEAIGAFAGLPHLRQVLGEIAGVTYVDDSKATNPSAAAVSVRAHSSVVLIAGGRSKSLDLTPLAEASRGRVRALVAIGESASEMLSLFDAQGIGGETAPSMEAAVRRAHSLAQPGDTVLLAPGCASHDMFRNQAERGDAFQASVRSLVREVAG